MARRNLYLYATGTLSNLAKTARNLYLHPTSPGVGALPERLDSKCIYIRHLALAATGLRLLVRTSAKYTPS